jgi:hypothetical protein
MAGAISRQQPGRLHNIQNTHARAAKPRMGIGRGLSLPGGPRPLLLRDRAMSATCIDCGIDTAPEDDRRRRNARTSEYYMVHHHVWHAAGMPEHKLGYQGAGPGFLCMGCLEARLGRCLTPADFIDAPINRPDRWNSPRLNARLTGGLPEFSEFERPVKLTDRPKSQN